MRSSLCISVTLACVSALVGATATAQPRVALHPLNVAAGRAGADDVAASLMLEVARQPIELAGSAETLAALAGHRCDAADLRCLSVLANTVQAGFTLLVELAMVADAWELKAIVVRDDGEVVRREGPVREPVAPDLPGRGARQAVRRLVSALDLGSLLTARPLAAAPPVEEPVADPVAHPTPVVVDRPRPAESRIGAVQGAGIGVGVVGVGCLGAGLALALVASDEAGQLTPIDGAIPVSQLEARRSSDGKATAATVLAVIGGVAAAAGVLMVALGGQPDQPQVAFAAGPDGAMVQLSVRLP